MWRTQSVKMNTFERLVGWLIMVRWAAGGLLELRVDADRPNGTWIGSIKSELMRPPFYIVPIVPDDVAHFNKLLRVDLDTGAVYTNAILPPDGKHVYKFSALSINQGTDTIVEIAVLDTITTTAIPEIRLESVFRHENRTHNSSDVPDVSNNKKLAAFGYNVKVLLAILLMSVLALVGLLYGAFYLATRQTDGKHRRTARRDSQNRSSFTCTSSTNLTSGQVEAATDSRLVRLIPCLRKTGSATTDGYKKSSTLTSIADSVATSGNSMPKQSGLFSYSDGYLNEMGIHMMDSLKELGGQPPSGITNDFMGDSIVTALPNRHTAPCFVNKLEYMDVSALIETILLVKVKFIFIVLCRWAFLNGAICLIGSPSTMRFRTSWTTSFSSRTTPKEPFNFAIAKEAF